MVSILNYTEVKDEPVHHFLKHCCMFVGMVVVSEKTKFFAPSPF